MVPRYRMYGTVFHTTVPASTKYEALGKELIDYNTKKHTTRSDMERVKIWNGVTASD